MDSEIQRWLGELSRGPGGDGRSFNMEAVKAFAAIGPAAVEPLLALLQNDSPDERAGAACALGEIGDVRATEALSRAWLDENRIVSFFAARAVRRLPREV